MRKSSVLVPARQNGIGTEAKLSVARPENTNRLGKLPSEESPRKMSLLSRKLLGRRDESAEGSEDAASSKRCSIVPGGLRPSISAGSSSRPSLVGLMASRKFAKKLLNRALDKRESTAGENPPSVRYEPTYRMDPKMKFQPGPVLEIVKDVIDNRLRDMKYNSRIAPNMNRILGDEIKDRVKKLNFERYKIIVVVMIGEKKGQGIMVSSRCSWDDKVDNHVSYSFQNKHIFCTCSVFGAYQE